MINWHVAGAWQLAKGGNYRLNLELEGKILCKINPNYQKY